MSVSLTMSGCGHNHYTRLCVCLSSLSIRRSFTGPEVQMLQCHHDNSHVETLDFHSWLDALFSLGFNDDIIPQHAEERSDLYCLWKPLQHNCGPFFSSLFFFLFFKSAGITGKMREKSHLSSVQQKQHILTSHWVCKMWFPEKGRTPPPHTTHPRMAAVLKCERWSRRRFHFDTSNNNIISVSQGSWSNSSERSPFRRQRWRWMPVRVETNTPPEIWGLLSTALLI